MIRKEKGFDSYKCGFVLKRPLPRTEELIVFSQPKGELVGPGKFVNQDTLVANAQGSSSLNYY